MNIIEQWKQTLDMWRKAMDNFCVFFQSIKYPKLRFTTWSPDTTSQIVL